MKPGDTGDIIEGFKFILNEDMPPNTMMFIDPAEPNSERCVKAVWRDGVLLTLGEKSI